MLVLIIVCVIAFFVVRRVLTGLYDCSVEITKHFEEGESDNERVYPL